jgi:hypothetical protein
VAGGCGTETVSCGGKGGGLGLSGRQGRVECGLGELSDETSQMGIDVAH